MNSNNIRGQLSWVLRNADGSVAAQGEENNLYTRSARRSLLVEGSGAYGEIAGLPGWVTLFDDEHPAGVNQGLRCLKCDTLTPTPTQGPTPTVVGYTRTSTGSFSSPSAQRTIRKVGLAGNGVWAGTISEGGVRGVSTYLQLTTPVVQEVGQTFEYVYRLSLVVNIKKSLRRFNSWTPINEAERATKLVSTTGYYYRETFSAFRCTWGSHYFVDGGLAHRGIPCVTQNPVGNSWNRAHTTFSNAYRGVRGATRSYLTTDSYNNYNQGPIGMFGANITSDGDGASANNSIVAGSPDRSTAFQALASHEGQITQVYKHPVGETYAWNVVGSIALSQGNVEVRGPYIPDESKTPWHWLHWIVMDTSGDTDGGTEGEYHVRRMGWGGYPYPRFYGYADDTWDAAEQIAAYFGDALSEVGFSHPVSQIAFDGEFYWMATYASGTSARLHRWRAGSNEQMQLDSVGDTTRWQPFTQPDANSLAYGVASDGNGSTWLLAPSSTLANQKLYRIDNTKPGRHYQRPSGYVENESPQTFNVSPNDEIHAMFPFAAGDVGKKIRYVNSASNGADSTRTITAYNGPYSVDVDGAAFVDETELLWHWVTVETKATNAWPAACKSTLAYDAANARLWTMSANGLHYSLDGGVTWATIDETNGLSTTLAKSLRENDGDTYQRTFLIGNGGKLYWIDTNNAVNKYTPVPVTIVSGTHERIPIASLAAPPGGYTTGTLATLVYDGTNPSSTDGDGALWIGQDRVAGRCFWRLACGPTFVGGGSTSYSEVSIGGTSGTYLHQSFQTGFVTADGQVYLRSRAYGGQWKRAYYDESTGTLSWTNAGAIWFGATLNGGDGDVLVRPNGLSFARASTRTSTISNSGEKSVHGGMVGAPVTYRYDDVADTWRPFHGSAAQFDAKYGTTNGGKRKCHATWQKLLKGSQPNNLELRFVQAGGGTAPTDEFKVGESFTFGAAFGTFRTNTQDLTWTIEASWADTEHLIETEAIKTVTGAGARKAYYWRVASSAGETAKPLGVAAYPTSIPEFNGGGVNFGWMPGRLSLYVSGYGSVPDSASATYGATSFSQHLMGLDLGAGPPAIGKLHTYLSSAAAYYLYQNYLRSSADRGRMRVYYSDDNAAWTEVPEVRFQLNGASPPDAGYANVYVEHYPQAGQNPANAYGPVLVTFDLIAAGLSVGARTHRYWQVHVGNNGTTNTSSPAFGGVWVSDANGVPLGLSANNRIDEAHDNDLGFCEITAVDFIQTRTGLSGQGGVNTVDDGDADGRTNIVTIAAGTFDTGVISTVTDYLAWKETPGVGNGYIRRRYGVPGTPGNWTTGVQARSRIVAVTSTQITVADDIIPDGLSAADFEIRRPATGTVLGPGTMPIYDRQTGYFQFDNADLGREFRVTRKAILRLP